jgi:SnoaL-like domain
MRYARWRAPGRSIVSSIPQFARYAAAFEQAYKSDDWSLVEPFFTEDAVYEVGLAPPMGGRFEGRDAILAYFKWVLDGFDRRFASREVGLVEGPREEGDRVWLRGSARYTAEGLPDLAFELDLIAWFEGDRIRRLEDRYDEANARILDAYARDHGAKLGLATRGDGASRGGRLGNR